MLTVISPAKSLDLDPVDIPPTQPAFAADALRLAKTARGLTLRGLSELMDISDDLARLNRDRFRDFDPAPLPDTAKPALFMFAGDTYQGLEAATLSADALRFATDHLRILSGLYGLLRPLDGIQPYRLEMGSRLRTRRGNTLYAYWGDTIARALRDQAAAVGTQTILNCASQEYFAAADRKALALKIITPQFLEVKDGRPRMVSFFAKRARGAMARFAMENRIEQAADLRDFSAGGYAYDEIASTPEIPVFMRDYPEPVSAKVRKT